MDCWWVKRISSDKYQYQHCYGSTSTGQNPNEMWKACLSVYTGTSEQIKKIHPDLVFDKDGEERLLIECGYRKRGNFDKTKLGFFLLSPKVTEKSRYGADLFMYQLVIVPKPGLFPGKEE